MAASRWYFDRVLIKSVKELAGFCPQCMAGSTIIRSRSGFVKVVHLQILLIRLNKTMTAEKFEYFSTLVRTRITHKIVHYY